MTNEPGLWLLLMVCPEKYVLAWDESAPDDNLVLQHFREDCCGSGRRGLLVFISICLDFMPTVALLEVWNGNSTLPTMLIWAYLLVSIVGWGILAAMGLSLLLRVVEALKVFDCNDQRRST